MSTLIEQAHSKQWFYAYDLPDGSSTSTYHEDPIQEIHTTRWRMLESCLDRYLGTDKSALTASSKTNGASLTLSASTPVVVLTGIGSADAATNTITLATPYPLYQTFTLTVASGSTNLIKVADSTTVLSLGSDWIGGPTDTLTFYTTATNKAVKVAASDN